RQAGRQADILSLTIYFATLFGTVANLILLFAFIGNAIKHKAFQPLDRIITNMAFVNLLLCCYKEIPTLFVLISSKVFGSLGCRILLYVYHTLRLVSIWSVENLSFLHLIKIRRPSHRWSKFIHRHQGQYVNWSLAGCWVISISFHTPYLLYSDPINSKNKSNPLMTSTHCIGPTDTTQLKILTYATVTLDFMLIILVIVLNGFTIDLICRHRRQVRDTMTVRRSWNKHTAQATRILLSLLLIYVVCWISSDMVWMAIVSGLIQNDYDNDMLSALYGILSSVYYSVSSCIMVFGYRQEIVTLDCKEKNELSGPLEALLRAWRERGPEVSPGENPSHFMENHLHKNGLKLSTGGPAALQPGECVFVIESLVLRVSGLSRDAEGRSWMVETSDMRKVGWLVDWLVGWLVGCSVDQQVGWLVAPMSSLSPHPSIYPPAVRRGQVPGLFLGFNQAHNHCSGRIMRGVRPRRPPHVDRREEMTQLDRDRDHSVSSQTWATVVEHDDGEDAEESPEPQAPGKIGAKKQKKLEEKQARKAQREAEEAEREERKKMELKRDEERRKDDERVRLEEEKKEEEERKAKEEEEKREYEEYLKLKESFVVEEEGVQESMTEEESRSFLTEFINYIKNSKVVILEELGAHFGLRAQDAISRIHDLLADGSITGVIDDRGKFIYITVEEMAAVAQFIRQRGRVSISELAQASNKLINLTPDTSAVPLEVS
ncbi:vomeronasal type-1 receptor 90-like, partial [Pelobates cultripes]